MEKKIKKEGEVFFYKKLKDKKVQCLTCPKNCLIAAGKFGDCLVRKNIEGDLYSTVYGKASSFALDPIEKKPLFHFLPGDRTFSFGTNGCNFHCLNCQNWEISQNPLTKNLFNFAYPKKIIEQTKISASKIISYTYNEPTVFYEYAFDTMKLAKKEGIKNVIVSNGFINKEPAKRWSKFIDGANIDFKGGKKFYNKICSGKLEPVLEAIELYHKHKIWLEIAYLIIPGYNDKEKDILELTNFIKSVDEDIPLHLNRFYPNYKMLDIPPTNESSLLNARKIALKRGLNYVYVGNIHNQALSTTFCPNCKKPLIIRDGFLLIKNSLINGRCSECNQKIPGIWK